MAVVHAEMSVWSKPWDHRFHMYGGQVCNTLMAGEFSNIDSVLSECVDGQKRDLIQNCSVNQYASFHILFINITEMIVQCLKS